MSSPSWITPHVPPGWLGALALLAATIAVAALRPGPWDWEQQLVDLAARHRPPAVHYAMFLITQAGGTAAIVATGIAVTVLLGRCGGIPPAAGFAAAVAGGLIATYAIKAVLGVERPTDLYGPGVGAAFPSAHASGMATLCVAAAALLTPSAGSARRMALAVAVVLAAVVGLSRVWLGVHWPLDVIGGVALGAVAGYLPAPLARHMERTSAACRAGTAGMGATVLVLVSITTAVLHLPVGPDEYPDRAPPAVPEAASRAEGAAGPFHSRPQRGVRSFGIPS